MADVQIAVIDPEDTQLALAAPAEAVVNVAVPGVQGPIGLTGSVAIAQAGTAAEPGIRFESDTNTGIYSPGADQLAISTNGTGRLFVDASGNVGINRSAPQLYAGYKTLEIEDTTGAVLRLRDTAGTAVFEQAANSTETYITNTVATPLTFKTTNIERMRLTAAGLLGLGTSSPEASLDISPGAADTIYLTAPIASGAVSRNIGLFTPAGGSKDSSIDFGYIDRSNNFASTLTFRTSLDNSSRNVARMHIDSSGRVGIGTSVPGARLQVNAPSSGRSYSSSVLDFSNIHLEGATANSTTSALTFSSGGGGGAAVAFSRGSSTDTSISFWTNSAAAVDAATERLRIDSSGRVGIGTSSPNTLLHVFGGDLKVQKSSISLNDISEITLSNVYRTGRILSSYTDPANTAETYIAFHTNRAGQANDTVGEAMRIAGGNVGIGTSSPAGRLHVNGGDCLFGSGSLIRLLSGGEVIDFSNGAQDAYVNGRISGLSLKFYTNNGSGIDIDSSGRVGIGTSNPGSLLHLADAGDISVGTTTGTKIGTATTQKIGFYNATPVVQPTAVADATDAATVITQLNALLTRMRNLGLIAT